jgi:hypothetical protein
MWMLICLSALGTLLVEAPFLLHLAGTSELQRLEVIFLGIGIILFSGIFLYVKRIKLNPAKGIIIGLTTAYLANALLCLIVYGETKFNDQSRSGWYVTLVIVIPILIDYTHLLIQNKEA